MESTKVVIDLAIADDDEYNRSAPDKTLTGKSLNRSIAHDPIKNVIQGSENPKMADTNSDKTGSFFQELLLNGQIAWHLYTDPRVSLLLKAAVPIAALLYFILPIDLLPDFIPVIGQLDEVALVLLLIRLFVSLAPADVVEEYRRGARGSDASAKTGPTPNAKTKTSSNGAGPQAPFSDVVDAEYRVVNDD